MTDPYAYVVHSPIGIARLPGRRAREVLARQVLGQLAREDGTVSPGSPEEQEIARQWLLLT